VEVYGGTNRDISHYYYQPSINPAFKDTIYDEKLLNLLALKTPTSLVETYYSCVMSTWRAVYDAIGLGAATTTG
jgi:hypothetical protein